MSGPRISTGEPGTQDRGTPWEFIRAVERKFGPLVLDLAATAENAKAPRFFTPEQDSLKQSWREETGLMWLNPQFATIEPWARKCKEETQFSGAKILMLVPASVGSNWWRDHVHNKAYVLFLNGRITFVGHEDPYPKDCALVCYGQPGPGYGIWTWMEEQSK